MAADPWIAVPRYGGLFGLILPCGHLQDVPAGWGEWMHACRDTPAGMDADGLVDWERHVLRVRG